MSIARFPRRRYTAGYTAIERMDRLSAALDCPTLWIKRDDQLGLAAGGNKTRKLEFLVADALAQGADTLVTTGAPQSKKRSVAPTTKGRGNKALRRGEGDAPTALVSEGVCVLFLLPTSCLF